VLIFLDLESPLCSFDFSLKRKWWEYAFCKLRCGPCRHVGLYLEQYRKIFWDDFWLHELLHNYNSAENLISTRKLAIYFFLFPSSCSIFCRHPSNLIMTSCKYKFPDASLAPSSAHPPIPNRWKQGGHCCLLFPFVPKGSQDWWWGWVLKNMKMSSRPLGRCWETRSLSLSQRAEVHFNYYFFASHSQVAPSTRPKRSRLLCWTNLFIWNRMMSKLFYPTCQTADQYSLDPSSQSGRCSEWIRREA